MRISDWSSDVCSSDLEELEKAVETYGIASELTMAVGDGANDILMMQAAGLGVAYHAKQKAREAADAEIVHGDLSVLPDRKSVVSGKSVSTCRSRWSPYH